LSAHEPSEPPIELHHRNDNERLSYLEGWVAGAQYALEHPTDQTAALANTMNLERLALWRNLHSWGLV
jgi:hypothetical protein